MENLSKAYQDAITNAVDWIEEEGDWTLTIHDVELYLTDLLYQVSGIEISDNDCRQLARQVQRHYYAEEL